MCPIKSMAKVRKHINIKLVITEGTRNYVVSEPNHHTTKFPTENLLPIYKPVYLSLWILDLSKTVMYEF